MSAININRYYEDGLCEMKAVPKTKIYASLIQKQKISENFHTLIFQTFSKAFQKKFKPLKCIYGEYVSLKFQVSRPKIG